jgi:transcriptional regulator of acetoin/glycerol metabolism
LLAAAAPVLDGLARHLEDTGFALLLADSSGCLVDLRSGQPLVRTQIERSGAVIGQLSCEPATGTNAIATALEQAERDAIWAALRANGGNKAKTAAYLGISRTTLYKALRSLGIWA